MGGLSDLHELLVQQKATLFFFLAAISSRDFARWWQLAGRAEVSWR